MRLLVAGWRVESRLLGSFAAVFHPLTPFVVGPEGEGEDDEGEDGQGELHESRRRVNKGTRWRVNKEREAKPGFSDWSDGLLLGGG